MDLVEIVFAHPHGEWFEAVLNEAAALIQLKSRVIASGDSELEHFQCRMLLRLGHSRLDQIDHLAPLTMPSLGDFDERLRPLAVR